MENVKKIISDNLFSFWNILDNSESKIKYENFDYILLGKNSSKRVWNTGNTPKLEEEFYELFNNEKVKKFNPNWFIEECDENRNIKELLEKNGLNFLRNTPGMAIKLKDYEFNYNGNEKLKIRIIDNPEEVELHYPIVCKELWKVEPNENHTKMFNFFLKQKNIRMYLGYCDGVPVSTGALYLNKDAAGIYLIATKEDYRKNGFGRYITEYITNDAKNLGYEYCILNATALGAPVYEKIGYKEYITYGIYGREN